MLGNKDDGDAAHKGWRVKAAQLVLTGNGSGAMTSQPCRLGSWINDE